MEDYHDFQLIQLVGPGLDPFWLEMVGYRAFSFLFYFVFVFLLSVGEVYIPFL